MKEIHYGLTISNPLFIIAITSICISSIMSQHVSPKPSPRWANECVLLAFKGELLCFGGQLESGTATNSMHSLDLYQSWNTSDPVWSTVEVASNTSQPATAYFAATYIPNSHDFLISGGVSTTTTNPSNNQTLAYYDTVQDLWTVPEVKGQALARRKQHTAVSDDKGRVWLWGGLSDVSTYGGVAVYYNEWTVLDTQTWTFSYPKVENNPPPRIDHTATIISNKYILIMGGVVYSHDVTNPTGQMALNPVSMSSINLFDIANNQWINVTAGGNIPAPRRGHSAVLSLDGKSIIIFGGGIPENEYTQLNDVFILELATMSWTAPSIKGVPPKPRRYHKSYLVDEYMLVAFGLSGDSTGFDDISILSTSSWSWITQYNANMAWLSGNTSSVSNGGGKVNIGNNHTAYNPDYAKEGNETRIKAGVIAGVVSGSIVILGGAIFLVLSIVIYKRKQIKRNQKMSSSNIVDPVSSRQESILFDFVTEPAIYFQKPDNRSSIAHYASHLEEGEHYKPDAKSADD